MSTIARVLLDTLTHSGDSPEDISSIRRNIAFLDRTDSRFSNIALGVLNDSHETVHSILKGMLIENRWIKSAVTKAHILSHEVGLDYNAATFILDYAIRTKSVTSMELTDDEATNFGLRMAVQSGDLILLDTYPFLRPVLTEATEDQINRYCHPLAVAAFVLGARFDKDRFLEEAPAFIMWAAEQKNLNDVLLISLTTMSVNQDTIEALLFKNKAHVH